MPRLCEFYPGICLTTEEKARKNLSQGKRQTTVSVVAFILMTDNLCLDDGGIALLHIDIPARRHRPLKVAVRSHRAVLSYI